MAARDDFPSAVRRELALRVANRCSNPDCRKVTSGPQENPGKSVNLGVAAHISAASFLGPRYNPNLSTTERASIENGIWLCQNCGKLVDNDPVRYTDEMLLSWKKQAERKAGEDIGKAGTSSTAEKDIRVTLFGGVAVQGPRELSFLTITVANHGLRPAFLDHPVIKLDRAEQFVWMNDCVTGAYNSRRELSPGNSTDYHFDVHELSRAGVPFSRVRDVAIKDALGNEYLSGQEDLPAFFEHLAAIQAR